jgi:hypothetical protein
MSDAFHIFSIILLLFGGLAFWPLVRFGAGLSGGASDWLKWQFHAHVLLLAGSFVLIQDASTAERPDWRNLHILPYAIGAFSWVAALIILFGGGLWRRVGNDSD